MPPHPQLCPISPSGLSSFQSHCLSLLPVFLTPGRPRPGPCSWPPVVLASPRPTLSCCLQPKPLPPSHSCSRRPPAARAPHSLLPLHTCFCLLHTGRPARPPRLLLLLQNPAEPARLRGHSEPPGTLSASTRARGPVRPARCLRVSLGQAAADLLTPCRGPGVTSPGPRGCLLRRGQGQRRLSPPASSCPALGTPVTGAGACVERNFIGCRGFR